MGIQEYDINRPKNHSGWYSVRDIREFYNGHIINLYRECECRVFGEEYKFTFREEDFNKLADEFTEKLPHLVEDKPRFLSWMIILARDRDIKDYEGIEFLVETNLA